VARAGGGRCRIDTGRPALAVQTQASARPGAGTRLALGAGMSPTDPAAGAPRTSLSARVALAVVAAMAIVLVLGLVSLFAFPILGSLIGFEAY
jgi:hypothetical protein